MANQTKVTYPVMPTSSWLKLREQFKRTIPGVLDFVHIKIAEEQKKFYLG